MGTLEGWSYFVRESARSQEGRAAMLAHREARTLAFGTEGKLRVLADLLAQHHGERTLVFTDDNATVYRVSQDFLLPAITHQTKVKERHDTLSKFRSGEYPVLVTSKVLNEGVDVPEAKVAVDCCPGRARAVSTCSVWAGFYGGVRASWRCYTK